MGTANDGQIPVSQLVAFQSSGTNDGYCLKGFECGADKGISFRTSRQEEDSAAFVTDNGFHVVAGFDYPFPQEVNFEFWGLAAFSSSHLAFSF
jgi:hypothetical protein